MVVALLALFVALDGPATAKRLIDGRSIKHGSIRSAQVRDRSLQTIDLSRKAVKSLQRTAPYSITSRQIAAKAVDGSKIEDAAVGTAALADRGVGTADLADGAVDGGQLAAGAVSASKLADGAVGPKAIADGTLQTRDIGDFYGSVSVDFKPFPPHTCQVGTAAAQPAAPGQGNTIADDVVLVSPAAGWPDPIIVTANPGANNTLRIVACRVDESQDMPTIDPDSTVFQYVGIDQP
ncbi:MAG TPA: hypothetical protein VFT50_13890 [Baekduia sp.]|nr:hypothetical protein [Baekduia sp.]